MTWTTARPAGDGTGDGWYYLRQRDGYTSVVCVDTSANGRHVGTFVYRAGRGDFTRVDDEPAGAEWYGPLPLPAHPAGVWDSYHLPATAAHLTPTPAGMAGDGIGQGRSGGTTENRGV